MIRELPPRARWIDDVASTVTGVAIGAIVSAAINENVPRSKRVVIFVLIATAGVLYLSVKHSRDADEAA